MEYRDHRRVDCRGGKSSSRYFINGYDLDIIANVMVVSGRLVAGMLGRSHPRKAIPRPKGIPIDP
jgi:hypothetical protein